jgi:hypothetical protein
LFDHAGDIAGQRLDVDRLLGPGRGRSGPRLRAIPGWERLGGRWLLGVLRRGAT